MDAEMDAEEVQRTSERFYEALTRLVNGDATAMTEIWSKTGDVSTMHPIGGRQIGWEAVRASWYGVAQIASEGQVELTDRRIRVSGDIAYETGVEQGRSRLAGREIVFENRVTNIYHREDAAWKIIHHHADVSPEMQEVVSPSSEGSDSDQP